METYFERYVVSGGVLMFFLIPLSLLAIGFIIQGFINLRKSRIAPDSLLPSPESTSSGEEISHATEKIKEGKDSLHRIISRIFARTEKEKEVVYTDDLVSETVEEEIARLYHNNSQLVIIYSVSPLLGLLGTILGMMKTFYNFSQSAEKSVEMLSIGINEALVTTMWGLAIAIPSFIFVHIFRHRLFKYQTEVLPEAVREVLKRLSRKPQIERE